MDDALLRPGRLEVQIEIGLPKEKGRTQILHIHTKKVILKFSMVQTKWRKLMWSQHSSKIILTDGGSQEAWVGC